MWNDGRICDERENSRRQIAGFILVAPFAAAVVGGEIENQVQTRAPASTLSLEDIARRTVVLRGLS
jgi:hypothetical protein